MRRATVIVTAIVVAAIGLSVATGPVAADGHTHIEFRNQIVDEGADFTVVVENVTTQGNSTVVLTYETEDGPVVAGTNEDANDLNGENVRVFTLDNDGWTVSESPGDQTLTAHVVPDEAMSDGFQEGDAEASATAEVWDSTGIWEFNDQQLSRNGTDTVVMDEAWAPPSDAFEGISWGYWIELHEVENGEIGESIGKSPVIGGGNAVDLEIPLDTELTEDTTVMAQYHLASDEETPEGPAMLVGGQDPELVDDLHAVPAGTVRATANVTVEDTSDGGDVEAPNVEFRNQIVDEGADFTVVVENVATDGDATVVLTFDRGNGTQVAGTNEDANDLNGENVRVFTLDNDGWTVSESPGDQTLTAHVVSDDAMSDGFQEGDAEASATAEVWDSTGIWEFNDQQLSRNGTDTVVMDEAWAPPSDAFEGISWGYWIELHEIEDGEIGESIGKSPVIGGGDTIDLEIPLDTELTEDTTVMAQYHLASDEETPEGPAMLVGGTDTELVDDLHAVPAGTVRATANVTVEDTSDGGDVEAPNVEFRNQIVDEGADFTVVVENVATDGDSTVVLTYDRGNGSQVAGTNEDANDLDGENVRVPTLDNTGWTNSESPANPNLTAHVVPDDAMSDGFQEGDAEASATAAVFDRTGINTFENQELSRNGNDTIVVDEAWGVDPPGFEGISEGYWVAIHRLDGTEVGDIIGRSDVIEGGVVGPLNITLEEEITSDTTLLAMLHYAEDGNTGSPILVGGSDTELVTDLHAVPAGSSRATSFVTVPGDDGGPPDDINTSLEGDIEFRNQVVHESATDGDPWDVVVENVSTTGDASVVATYTSGGSTFISGINPDADNLDDENLRVVVEGDFGWTASDTDVNNMTVHVVPDEALSGIDVAAANQADGPTIPLPDVAAENAVASAEAVVFQGVVFDFQNQEVGGSFDQVIVNHAWMAPAGQINDQFGGYSVGLYDTETGELLGTSDVLSGGDNNGFSITLDEPLEEPTEVRAAFHYVADEDDPRGPPIPVAGPPGEARFAEPSESTWGRETVELTVPEGDPANFAVTGLEVPDEAAPGDEIEVTFSLNNTGDLEATQVVLLHFDGEVIDSFPIGLEGGEPFSFDYSYTIPEDTELGDHEFNITTSDDGMTTSISIVEAGSDPTSTATDTTPTDDDTDETDDETATTDGTTTDTGGQPGFTAGVTLVMLLLLTVFWARRE